ncbi:hypothetical protein A4H97_25105 [Niastella yeongjuensis]|uniref:Transcriptional regulator n=1 Tax=Niastella yeongjuensis TaxID=354355 RepID=A0A1V9F2N4_9BACT|nr:hypothetical protein [Niastella yeongjuensis]OQP52604.1 hypothetical protein A4H97_25105 [Niastella yeongjuensis]SEP33804.1 hypothetical protein SAMN05660816_05331 [Niastella yeongjuensis]
MDKRYESIKFMIETGHITEFRQIFNYMPKSPLGKYLHTNNPRITRLTSEVDDLTVQEIVSISSFFDVDYMKIIHLVFAQYIKDRKIK